MTNFLNKKYNGVLYFIILSFFFCCFLVSPLLSFFGIIILFAIVEVRNKSFRYPLTVLAFFSGAVIYSSRVVGNIYGDDFANEYYPLYNGIYKGEGILDGDFGGGVEIGLSSYFKLLSIILPHLSESGVMLSVSLLCTMLFYFWIEFFLFKDYKLKNETLFLASVLLFFGYFVTTQLMRQAISTVFILYSLSYWDRGCKFKSVISICIGGIFHLTAIPLVFIFHILMGENRKLKIWLVGIFFAFGFLFTTVLKIISGSGIFFGVVSKFLYYLTNTESGFATAYYWKLLLPVIIISFFISKDESPKLKSLLFYGVMSYLCLIEIPFASDRVFMLMNIYLLGGIVFVAFSKFLNGFRLVVISLCIMRFILLGPYYNFECGNTVLCLWGAYPWLGSFL
ncbi:MULTISPECIES: EpsG family protein [unclassified Tatumella]|uniref:EpsG family protein n=1 Tax=unclassified Tatumella TaxID=2649542 RepID=UPI001BAEE4BE|nr:MULTISPECIES: EpsG family protein [unclassified Tatumella]MBS0876913.1 EpsG family protein [Tatumella sp. JGM82]MBS0891943.1 EpsG family protein [Tatumella sp. JGM94]MBS0900547.1 EpsG family protein [Tatumella sp. JGM100]